MRMPGGGGAGEVINWRRMEREVSVWTIRRYIVVECGGLGTRFVVSAVVLCFCSCLHIHFGPCISVLYVFTPFVSKSHALDALRGLETEIGGI